MSTINDIESAIPRDKLLHFISGTLLMWLALYLGVGTLWAYIVVSFIIIFDKAIDLKFKPGAVLSECAWDAVAGLLGTLPVFLACYYIVHHYGHH